MSIAATTLFTPRLVIRPVAASDLPDLMAVNGDDAVTRFLPYDSWRSPQDGQAWLERMEGLQRDGGTRQFVVARAGTGPVIGTLLLFKLDVPSARLELGYVLGRAHWGQGLMQEAVGAACGHVFGSLKLRRIEAEVQPDNTSSVRLLQRLGFSLEGRARQRWVAKGRAYDTLLFGLLADEWSQRDI